MTRTNERNNNNNNKNNNKNMKEEKKIAIFRFCIWLKLA